MTSPKKIYKTIKPNETIQTTLTNLPQELFPEKCCEIVDKTIEWDNSRAHSAMYDTEKTAELFCKIHNLWLELSLK